MSDITSIINESDEVLSKKLAVVANLLGKYDGRSEELREYIQKEFPEKSEGKGLAATIILLYEADKRDKSAK